MDAEEIAEDYLSSIEREDFKKAYMLIDGVSRRFTTYGDFENYWKEFFKRYGKPFKHAIHDVSKEGTYAVVEYTWHFKKLSGVDTSIFLDQRSYRLRLKFEFRKWAVKFRKYYIIKETPTPYGVKREIINE